MTVLATVLLKNLSMIVCHVQYSCSHYLHTTEENRTETLVDLDLNVSNDTFESQT